jgi:hypothetical protein
MPSQSGIALRALDEKSMACLTFVRVSGSSDVHIRFLYRGCEYVVSEPFSHNSRWWVGPEDTDAPHVASRI